jgi:23S rRNA pseudouridine1911/1915/1917 synthase
MPDDGTQETTVSVTVPAGYREGERVDVYLTAMLANATRSKVQRGIREERVLVNGTPVKPSYRVQPEDHIECRLPRPPPIEAKPERIPLDIRFEDDYIIVLDKQAPLVVHPAYGNRTGTLVNALLYHVGAGTLDARDDLTGRTADVGLSTASAYPTHPDDVSIRPGLVHRLDKDTSGLMVIAKDDVVHARLALQFYHRSIQRSYLALVWGHPSRPEGRIETRLGRDPRDRKKVAVVSAPAGKNAVTHYHVVEYLPETALLALRLETGRTHQIRVHAQHIGHPILGDPTYGGDRLPRISTDSVIRTAAQSALGAMRRQALHAATLGFVHPTTGKDMLFRSEPPQDFQTALEVLRSVSTEKR